MLDAAAAALDARRHGALRDLRRLRRERAPRAASDRSGCSHSFARTAPGSSGPNCLGIAVPRTRPERDVRAPRAPAGTIGFSSQSGALGLALLEKAAERSLGFSAFVSIGNKADVSSNDLLEWWEDDDATDLVLLYLESFGNPRAFARIARARRPPEADPRPEGRVDVRRLARRRLAHRRARRLRDGRRRAVPPGRRAARRHARGAGRRRRAALDASRSRAAAASASSRTPAASGSSAPTPARRRGSSCPSSRPRRRAALLATVLPARGQPRQSGRPARLGHRRDLRGRAAAAARRPERRRGDRRSSSRRSSPAPTRSRARSARRRRPTPREARDRRRRQRRRHPAALRERRLAGGRASPTPSRRRGRSRFAADRAEWLRRPAGARPPSSTGSTATCARGRRARRSSGRATAGSTPTQLARCSRPTASRSSPSGSRATAEDAVEAARRARLSGRREDGGGRGCTRPSVGGVALDLRDERQVRDAVERIGAPRDRPAVSSTGGVELLAGVVQDPVFGPLVAFGPGGVFAELIGDAGFRLAPLTDVDADELVHGGKAGRLVAGFRGAPPADAGALADLVAPARPARRRDPRGRRARPQPGSRGAGRLRRGRRARPRRARSTARIGSRAGDPTVGLAGSIPRAHDSLIRGSAPAARGTRPRETCVRLSAGIWIPVAG